MIPFHKPVFSDGDLDEITRDIRRILTSGWLTSGVFVRNLESAFARHLGSKHCVAVSSCTAALHLSLLALDVGPGDEVIVPTNTFVATANAALYVGAKPVFADCDEETFDISPEDVERKITKKTRAIVPVHLGGSPCNMVELTKISDAHHVPIVEDCAHALGSRYKALQCGTMGVAGAFSLYATKVVTAGEGGMVATDSGRVAQICKVARNSGRAGFGPLETTRLGFNYRMPDPLAAIAVNQFTHLGSFLRTRNRIAERYSSRLKRVPWVRPQAVRNDCSSSYYAYIVELVDAPLSRDALMKRLARRGIETSVLYNPVHLQPFYRRMFGFRRGSFPVSERLGRNSLALPMHVGLANSDVDRIAEEVARAGEKG